MATVQDRAAQALGWFEDYKRGVETITVLRDGAPDWVRGMVYAAHGDMSPDDWRYECIRAALEFIAEHGDDDETNDEFPDTMVYVYTGDRLAWLASHLDRPAYCDDAFSEGWTTDAGIVGLIGLGQYREAAEVFGLVMEFLRGMDPADLS